ncbi:Toll/interleukin-1 receptor domain-containing protein, partial [Tanacetum coccineum]
TVIVRVDVVVGPVDTNPVVLRHGITFIRYVLGVSFNSESDTEKIGKAVYSLEGVESVEIHEETGRLIVIGHVDPLKVETRVREFEKMVQALNIVACGLITPCYQHGSMMIHDTCNTSKIVSQQKYVSGGVTSQYTAHYYTENMTIYVSFEK